MLETNIYVRFGSFSSSQNAPNHCLRKIVQHLLEPSNCSKPVYGWGSQAFAALKTSPPSEAVSLVSSVCWACFPLKLHLRSHQMWCPSQRRDERLFSFWILEWCEYSHLSSNSWWPSGMKSQNPKLDCNEPREIKFSHFLFCRISDVPRRILLH